MINTDLILCCSLSLNILLLSLLFFRNQIRVEVRPYRSIRNYLGHKVFRHRAIQTEPIRELPQYAEQHMMDYVYPYCDRVPYPHLTEPIFHQYCQYDNMTYSTAPSRPPSPETFSEFPPPDEQHPKKEKTLGLTIKSTTQEKPTNRKERRMFKPAKYEKIPETDNEFSSAN